MKIDARLTFDKIRFDQDFDKAHLVLSLIAPAQEATTKRPPICIIPVIDVSPSMQGQKIDYAKKSVLKLIDHLQSSDYCGLVQFSGSAQVLAKPTKVTAATKDDLKRRVGDLRIGSATNIAAALLTGLQVANEMDLPAEVITRVILFTDGEANTGVATSHKDILALVNPNLGLATVSAFGYGHDAKQDLLGDMAKSGKGNYAFVENPDDALTAFGKELGGLLSTYATDLTIELTPHAGHRVSKVVTDVDAEEEDIGGEMTIKIPDILGEETRHIVLGVKLAEQKGALPRPVNVFDVKLSYDVLDANRRKERKTVEGKVKAQFVKQGEEQEKPHADLDKLVGLAEVVRAQIEAEELAKKGDYLGAQGHMRKTAAAVHTRGLVQLQALADSVSDRLGSQSLYAQNASYLTSMARGGTRGMGVASYDAHAAADLDALGVQLSNSVQTSTSNAFAGGAQPAVVVGDQPAPGAAVDLSSLLSSAAPVIPNPALGSGGIVSGDLGGVASVTGSLGVGAMWAGSPAPVTPGAIVAPPVAPAPSTNEQDKKSKSAGKKIKHTKSSSRW